jgi:hypothetical protein
MQLPVNSFDVVFSNWLLMYLDNEEVAKLAADSLRWVSISILSCCCCCCCCCLLQCQVADR